MDDVLQDLFAYAFLICGDRSAALRELLAVLQQNGTASDVRVLLTPLARKLDRGRADTSIVILDNLLRREHTPPLPQLQPEEVRALAWALKRACLTATLGCLSPSIRQAFVLREVMGYSRQDVAEILGITLNSLGVRLSRATRRLDGILAVRCQHYDRLAPCTCTARLGHALDADFISAPESWDTPAGSHDADGPIADVRAIFRTLPRPVLSAEEAAGLIALASSRKEIEL